MSKKSTAKKPTSNIVIVHDNSGDWVGIYVDGKLVREGHSIQEEDVLDAIGIPNKSVWVDMEDSRLPENLDEIKDINTKIGENPDE
jgi:hypothetical protein